MCFNAFVFQAYPLTVKFQFVLIYLFEFIVFNLASRGVSVKRAYCGTLMTSLEMAGISLTIMQLDSDGIRARCLGKDPFFSLLCLYLIYILSETYYIDPKKKAEICKHESY